MGNTRSIMKCIVVVFVYFDPFLASVPTLYPLKGPENQGHKMATLARNPVSRYFIIWCNFYRPVVM